MTTARERSNANLLAGRPHPDPEIEARRKRGLKPGAHMSHGAYGGQRLAELRAEHDAALAIDYPSFDVRRRVLLADRLARCQAAMSWADENGITPTAKLKHGQAFPIINQLDKWSAQADALIAQAIAAERERTEGDPLAARDLVLAEYAAADPDDATVIPDHDESDGNR